MTSIVQNYQAYEYKPIATKDLPESMTPQNAPERVQKTTTEKESKMLSAKYVKPNEAKKLVTVVKEWLNRYTQRPHRHDFNDIKDNAVSVIDIIEGYQKQSNDKNSPPSLNRLS